MARQGRGYGEAPPEGPARSTPHHRKAAFRDDGRLSLRAIYRARQRMPPTVTSGQLAATAGPGGSFGLASPREGSQIFASNIRTKGTFSPRRCE